MRSKLKRALVLGVCICSITYCPGAQEATKPHGPHAGDLVSALEFVSTTFHIPIIAEITKSYPAHVSVSAGQNTADELLNALCAQFPGYSWENRDGVALFYDNRLRNAPGNFFNANIANFVVPGDLANLILELNQAMAARPNEARVMVGVPEKSLSNVKLRRGQVLANVSGRDVLVEAAKQSRDLFSVVLFPTANPKTQVEVDEAHNNWYVRSIGELQRNPTNLRSIPPKP